jgi:hypothetical protein
MQLPVSLRYRIVAAYVQCNSYSYSLVSRRFGVSVHAVRRWVKRAAVVEVLVNKPSSGRPKIITEVGGKAAMNMLLSGDFRNAKQIGLALHINGHTINGRLPSAATVIRAAKAAAVAAGTPIRAVFGKPAKRLTQATMAKRLAFCQQHLNTDWRLHMFSDRKRFHFMFPGTAVNPVSWAKRGEHPTANHPNHPNCVNLYAGITKYGITKVHIVTGTTGLKTSFKNKTGQASRNITQAEYSDVVLQTLAPEGKRVFTLHGISHWHLQQDNDPAHRAVQKSLATWNSANPAHTISLLPHWPPNSPDLNPIENLWAWVQAEVNAKGCESFAEFKQCVLHTLQNVPIKVLKGLIGSMRSRLEQCIARNGGLTDY